MNEKPNTFIKLADLLSVEPKQQNCCVVRLSTDVWADKKGLYMKKRLSFLRRKSEGFNALEEEIDITGVEYVLPRILNFHECNDGIYEVVTCNESRDPETGYIDNYDYHLQPYESQK